MSQANTKGSVQYGKFSPIGVKDKIKTRVECTTYTGNTMSNPEHKGASTPIKSYRYQGCMHMIQHGMNNIFDIPDTKNYEFKWELFQCLG